jgi:hypothetical protein
MAIAVFVCVLAGAFFGSAIGRRLAEHHLSESSKDVIKSGAGYIGTMAALVLGMLVASAKSSYDAKFAEVEQTAAKIIVIDRVLRQYGSETKPARDMLRDLLQAKHSLTWVNSESLAVGQGTGIVPSTTGSEQLRAAIATLSPANEAQRVLQIRALQALDDFTQMRWLFIAQSTDSISIPLLAVLALWVATVALLTGMYAPRNSTLTTVAVLCALSVSVAVFLIAEMYSPFEGLLRISDAPLRTAMGYLNQ